MGSKAENLAGKMFYALIAVAAGMFGIFIVSVPIVEVIKVAVDDMGYYMKISENMALGLGPTFDGLHLTNGYHPLWFLVLTVLHYFLEVSPDFLYRSCLILQLLLVVGSIWMLYVIHSHFLSRSIALISSIVFFEFVFFRAINGMESALLVFFLSATLFFGWKSKVFIQKGLVCHFILGVMLGLCVLIRMDMIFLMIAVYGFTLFRVVFPLNKKTMGIRLLAAIMAGSLILVVPNYLYNYFFFGHLLPISALMKVNTPVFANPIAMFSKIGVHAHVAAILAMGYTLGFPIALKRTKDVSSERFYFRNAVLILSLAVLMHYTSELLFLSWGMTTWHFMMHYYYVPLVLAVPVSFVLSKIPSGRWQNYCYGAGTVILMILVVFNVSERYGRMFQSNFRSNLYEASLWAHHHSEEQDIFAMADAGIFGYFSRRRTINLDGVVNDFSYQRALKEKRLASYLKENQVKYLMDKVPLRKLTESYRKRGEFRLYIPSHLYEGEGDSLLLQEENEVWRSEPFNTRSFKDYVFVMWKMKDSYMGFNR